MRRIVSLFAVASAACGNSNNNSAPETAADAGNIATDAGQCPASLGGTVGVSCQAEGLFCAPTYTCDLIQIPLLCTCTKGLFVCTDGVGNAVDAGETPGCPAPAAASCPLSENSATMAACSQIGLICPYPSACDAGTDSCECVPAAMEEAGPNLVFQCQTTCISSDATPTEAQDGSTRPVDAGASE
ncbi:MAG: hypothetical protein WBY94_07470 [Polyangiaceae bacterium]